MQLFIAHENIKRFNQQLGDCPDQRQRETSEQLLAAEEGFTRKVQTMFDMTWQPGEDFAAGMTAYYLGREAHERKLATAAYREWEEYFGLAEKYRLLAEKAAFSEGLGA